TYGSALDNMWPQTMEKSKIPLEEIRKAISAEDFVRRIFSKAGGMITNRGKFVDYFVRKKSSKPGGMITNRGKFVDCCNDREAFFKHWASGDCSEKKLKRIQNELLLISSFHHENITPFIGFCNEDNNIIIASEYALNGSLYLKLETQDENSYLTWAQRLKICLGAARGLKCFHAGFGDNKVVHGDFNSRRILLYDNLEAKICGFGKSFLVPRSHPDTNVYVEVAQRSEYYMDPVYRDSYIPRIESDVYSFGVGTCPPCPLPTSTNGSHPVEDERISMINWVRRYSDEVDKLIDYRIRDEIDARSLHTFKDIAYKCISFNMKDRPSMSQVVKRLEEALYIQTHGASSTIARKDQKLEDFRIPLEDINLAIGVKNQDTHIGEGGFGMVYKGQPLERWQNRTVAIKCLRPESYQGEYEFRNELNMIFSFSHENIIPFIGYCDEGSEKIIVYEYASNGSLDCHLTDKNKRRFLTWEHRLKICLGAAKGLDYLHSGLGEDNRVIHRDVKSGNILLDHNLVAKVCDFGLSKSGPINQQHTQVYTNAAGTNFYMDPVYHESGILRKESDVYSFGVVMFELLSGMLAYNQRRLEDGKPKPLINIVRRYYDYKPDLIIDPLIRDEVDNRSFNVYIEVAFQCLSFNSKERPTMEMIVDRVEEALELQMVYVLTTLMPELMKDDTVEAIRQRNKWENDDYICRGPILNGMSDPLFDIYQNVELAKELWDSLESKYMAEDASSQKIFGQYTQHGLKIDESISVSSVIDKLPPSWKDFKHTLKHGKEVVGPSVNMTEEGGKNKNNKQNKGKKRGFNENNGGSGSNKKPKLECWKCGKTGHFKRDCRSGKKSNANAGGLGKGSKDQSQEQGQNLVNIWNRLVKYYVSLISKAFYVQVDAIAWWIDFGATTYVCKDRCWFKTYEPVEDGFVLYMSDDHFAPIHGKGSVVLEFSSGKSITLFNVLYIPKLHKNLISGPVLNKCGYKQVHESDKYILSKFDVFVGFGYYNNGMFMLNLNKVPDDFGFLYMSSFNIANSSLWHARLGHVHYKRILEMFKDDLIPTINENPGKCTTCMLTIITRQSFRSIIRKSVILELIHSDLCDFHATPSLGSKKPKDVTPNSDESQRDDHSYDAPSETPEPRRGCKPLGCKYIFKRKMKVNGTIDKFKARLVIQGFKQKEGINYFDTYTPVARITTIRLLLALAAIHNLMIHQMDVKIAFLNGDLEEEVTRPDIAYAVGRLSRFTSNPSRQHWQAITRVFKYLKDSSSTNGSVLLLGRGVISWVSKKQTCITGSSMESEFIALAAAVKKQNG
ncbi:protein kinase, ATP binding site-containing protein, partial [Tanacetum coccineum]